MKSISVSDFIKIKHKTGKRIKGNVLFLLNIKHYKIESNNKSHLRNIDLYILQN